MRSISQRAARLITAVPIAVACLALVGWQFRIPVLKGDLFGTYIAPNAALCFILCGIAILCETTRFVSLRRIGMAIGVFVTVFALATLAEYIFGIDFGIDRIFFAHRLSDWKLPFPGRFAFNTALAFTFAGIAVVALRRPRAPIAELGAGFVLIISYLALVGRAYSVALLYSRVMSPHTAILFGFLGVALLCASARHNFIDTAVSPNAGGVVFRRMLIAVLILVPLLGILRVQLERRGLLRTDIATPVFVVITVAVFTVLTLHTATVLNQIDRRRQQTEQALIQTEKLAAAGRMAATVAHEINNPLEAVTNLLFLLKDGVLDPRTRNDYIRMAEEELARVAAITKRTLGFYREERRASAVDLGRVMDEVLELYARKLDSSAIAVTRSYGECAPVVAPEGEIRQIFTNLLSNAIDALLPKSGRIDVAIEQVNEKVVFTFADNGTGISERDVQHVFEPFFTTKKDVGNGLGLWVTKTLVEKNAGRIEMKTRTDAEQHGTTFRIAFPASSGNPSPSRSPVAREAGAAD